MIRLLVLFIKAYQHTVGVLMPRVCRFEPTCSNYAIEAIVRHGAVKGSLLGAWRILRCNPFIAGGFDPVPASCKVNHCRLTKDPS